VHVFSERHANWNQQMHMHNMEIHCPVFLGNSVVWQHLALCCAVVRPGSISSCFSRLHQEKIQMVH
jgi:hypothetical protein